MQKFSELEQFVEWFLDRWIPIFSAFDSFNESNCCALQVPCGLTTPFHWSNDQSHYNVLLIA